jgi:hypothetical protein
MQSLRLDLVNQVRTFSSYPQGKKGSLIDSVYLVEATLAAARVQEWEGRNPGGILVFLSNPRGENMLLRFLELSGVRMRVEGVKTRTRPMQSGRANGLCGTQRRKMNKPCNFNLRVLS